MHSFLCLFLLFIIYSIIGYIVEICACSIEEGKIVFSRGYMIGPYIPLYGIGALASIYLLDKYRSDILVLFIMGVVLCALLEYITSLLMEKIFKLRWWDYTDRKFNINGRVCLEYSVLFGFGCIIIVKFVNPLLVSIIEALPNYLVYILGLISIILFIVDFIESTYITCHLKINISKYINRDATKTIKKEVINSFMKHRTFINRLLKAFPDIEKKLSANNSRKIIKKIRKKNG